MVAAVAGAIIMMVLMLSDVTMSKMLLVSLAMCHGFDSLGGDFVFRDGFSPRMSLVCATGWYFVLAVTDDKASVGKKMTCVIPASSHRLLF
jgi:hypothetical protein